MKKESIVMVIYALIAFTGGVIGLLKAGSLVSLIMAGAFALVLLACSIFVYKGSQAAYDMALGFLMCLLIFFVYRYTQSYRIMPAGMMSIITAVVLAYLGTVRFQNKLNSK